ncbi:MAG: ABC transporter permease [Caldilineaceae bacterium]|nr:ABC transporter permease [Caldilineaceae bacterium]MBP8107800.1 ABC transporter permease [Caldilineaceae bacterium]MBP8121625.1 ABC transporter permease [Caldilineaceae bacterium]MBP9073117.1 ABC transporter permease [Caldilineaceae bacterium]
MSTPLTSRQKMMRRVLREPTTMFGLIMVAIFIVLALFAPLLSPVDPIKQNIPASLTPPSADFWLGTDKLGRDILSRILYGTRISLTVGLAVVFGAGSFGVVVGLVAGYLGGWVDEVIMRITDIFFAFPSLILAMSIAGALGPSLVNALIAVGVVSWPIYARLIRGQVIILREQEFVVAAQAIGAPAPRIILRHLLPNTLAPLLVQASFDMGGVILSVAGLSFIGFGAQPPTPEWGVMISEGRNYITTQWWLTAMPAAAILLLVAAFNLIGDGLRDLLDPRLGR